MRTKFVIISTDVYTTDSGRTTVKNTVDALEVKATSGSYGGCLVRTKTVYSVSRRGILKYILPPIYVICESICYCDNVTLNQLKTN